MSNENTQQAFVVSPKQVMNMLASLNNVNDRLLAMIMSLASVLQSKGMINEQDFTIRFEESMKQVAAVKMDLIYKLEEFKKYENNGSGRA